MKEKIDLRQLPAIYGRSKGADWFEAIYKRDIIIIGAGGIGSWLSLFLSRTGANLFIYDYDHFENHNGGQVMFREDEGKLKTEAIKSTIASFSPDCEVTTFGKYIQTSDSGKIVICGPDNIPTRRLAFNKWATLVSKAPVEQKREYFFMDGRLLAEQLQIFCFSGDMPSLIEKYRTEFLFEPDEDTEESCTFKQTTPMAGLIAAQMIGYLTNWLTNLKRGRNIRRIPFSYEYLLATDTRIVKYE
ncbi:hypothetical protein HGH93_23535 [Chitinophaga polysaccharea]|uniref:ThiF family adenylyltransferase n=1 Tax=Chitinophaga polysaccharea TaxID=1293035 RepID=UPI001455802C|nr:ThiF family adenylyltransferase [Chitinophaga polysaccharea]NLR61094.1 hypothetical protein [Chitinophaga polysaccharea]